MNDMCNTTGLPDPTDSQWIQWYLSDISDIKVDELFNYTIENCTKSLCREFKWEGNSDLAGRGMMVTYWLEGALACVYAMFLYAERTARFRKWTTAPPILLDLSTAVIDSSAEFLSSMLLFCLAMLVAALHGYATALTTKDGITEAERIGLVFMAVFTILPPILVQCLIGPLRRKRLRIGLWVLICLLATSVRVLAAVTPSLEISELKYGKGDIQKQNYEDLCAPQAIYLWRALKGFEIIAPVALAFSAVTRMPWLQHFEIFDVYRSLRWKLPAALSFGGIWVFLAIFSAYRQEQGQVSGASNKERAWGFGQVLALATWAPAIVDFVYIFLFGSERGLQGRMPENFKVVKIVEGAEDTTVSLLVTNSD
ncbi:uncharacterized protein BDR25DRAFT_319445 [Lindgomyces ingoldianus]|uniref:Uncharacterized protein n=1 Tax=Lindgomyces ingoldianus TaxID=673940 RepID=A0ACB6QB50_9PLEO|nr:uncharacterized protein BDR25DRAFT_319445 [Lindgomyces ingoldianus]KAF2464188.1 hypothetical protein BDR25DRAFT_319445 [Lindgomyces ingoldianus]